MRDAIALWPDPGNMFRQVQQRWLEWQKLFLSIIPNPEIHNRAQIAQGGSGLERWLGQRNGAQAFQWRGRSSHHVWVR